MSSHGTAATRLIARLIRPAIGTAVLMTLGTQTVLGQDHANGGGGNATGNGDESDFKFTLTPGFRYAFDSELDGPSDTFSVVRGGVDFDCTWKASDDTSLVFNVGYEVSSYNFEAPNSFLAGTVDPFDTINILDGGLTGYFKVNDHWTAVAGVRGRVAGQSSVDVGDAGTIGGLVGAVWARDEDHKVGFGVYAGSQIEDDVLVLPVVQVDWRLNDTTRLVGKGTSGQVVWQLSESTDLGVGAAWENRRFRLDDDAIHLSSVVEDTSVPIFVRLSHRTSDNLEISLVGGVVAFQDFEISDRSGNNSRTFDASPTGFVGVDLRVTF